MAPMPHQREKVVYVLGAGFSRPAGAPNQSEILKAIFNIDPNDERFRTSALALRQFLQEDLGLGKDELAGVPLEDIYTPIDRCIADRTSFRSHSTTDLVNFREELGFLISTAIAQQISDGLGSNDVRYIQDFAKLLVEVASHRAALAANTVSAKEAKIYDPFSIISLNWDILLDNALHDALYTKDARSSDYDPFGVVDYCCYVSSLEPGDSRIRSGLWSLGCRGFNVKLLKLHGSMNWLQCPNCQRLFIGFGDKRNLLAQVGQSMCRHCEKCGHRNKLVGSLIMPTFLKDLTNFQIKLVWQNAGVELMEATKVVFIGYSLPYADFEFRQLLARMIGKNVPIHVVLHQGTSPKAKQNYKDEVRRYRQLFGAARTTFNAKGVIDFVGKLLAAAGGRGESSSLASIPVNRRRRTRTSLRSK